MAESSRIDTYDGIPPDELARRGSAQGVELFGVVSSTMDEAHTLAAQGAAAGTVILADAQSAGRGRNGKRWASPSRGIWMTLIERPQDVSAIDVLSLRIGLAAARALDAFTIEPVRLKWPNDLFVDGAKIAGVLVEARWRGEHLDWVAIGLGVNMEPPAIESRAGALEPGSSRIDVLCALVPELRAAAERTGQLSGPEMDEYAARDLARGRECIEPTRGRVVGIASSGELLIELADSIARVRSGSLTLLNSD